MSGSTVVLTYHLVECVFIANNTFQMAKDYRKQAGGKTTRLLILYHIAGFISEGKIWQSDKFALSHLVLKSLCVLSFFIEILIVKYQILHSS